MHTAQCPRCGSDQVLNDQCLKCGIVLSRYHVSKSRSADVVSFVGTSADGTSPGYSIPASVLETRRLRQKQKLKSTVANGIILLVIMAAGFAGYRFFLRHASHYSGQYKNGALIFAVNFPQHDSQWYHYQEGQADSPLYKDAADAFYRGGDPNDPEIVLGFWTRGTHALPERMSPEFARQLQAEEEQALTQILEEKKVEVSLTDSQRATPGGNDGFRWELDIKVDGKPQKLIVLRAYYLNHSYWIFVSGTEEMMNRNRDELEGILGTFNFRVSVI